MRRLWKLAMVCTGMLLLMGGLRQAEGTLVCPDGGLPCSNFQQCRDHCATFPDTIPERSICHYYCCLCAVEV